MVAIPIKVNGATRRYHILFKSDANIIRMTQRGGERVQQIQCAICNEDLNVLAAGMALKSSRDRADSYKGAKLAFTRAVEKFTRNKDIRAALWAAYRKAGGH